MSFPNTPEKEDSSLYNSALENLTYSTLNDSENGNLSATDTILGNDHNNTTPTQKKPPVSGAKAASISLIQSESADNLEVDPKSNLANKTIFKTDNPNLSIIEISDTFTKDDETSVYLIESSDEEEQQEHNRTQQNQRSPQQQKKSHQKSPSPTPKLVEKSSPAATSLHSTISTSPGKNLLNVEQVKSEAAGDASTVLNETSEQEPLIDNDEKILRTIKVYDTMEEFDKNLPSTVTVLDTPFGSRVYLVGTAHFSQESQDDVSYVIRNVRPDIVMVELCQSRIHILKYDEKSLLEEAKNINLAKIRNIINSNGFVNGIFYILLLHMSAQLAKELGMAPGGEFRRAFEEVHRLPGCVLQLGDRPINITLQRALRALSFWQTVKLVWHLTSNESISVEDVEKCKQRDLLEKLMQEVAGEFPAFSDVMVKERDLYLCHSLQSAALPQPNANGMPRPVKVVGVIGIGHADGITKNWGKVDPKRIPEILIIPPVSTSTKIIKFTVKYGFIAVTAYGVFKLVRPRLGGLF